MRHASLASGDVIILISSAGVICTARQFSGDVGVRSRSGSLGLMLICRASRGVCSSPRAPRRWRPGEADPPSGSFRIGFPGTSYSLSRSVRARELEGPGPEPGFPSAFDGSTAFGFGTDHRRCRTYTRGPGVAAHQTLQVGPCRLILDGGT